MTANLRKPVVAVARDNPTSAVTLPVGATIEFNHTGHRVGLAHIWHEGKHYSVFLHDLLDAMGDVGKVLPWV
jgi:hypothetical protein